MDLPGRDTALYMLARHIAESRRYGRPFAVVRLELPPAVVPDALSRLREALRDADSLVAWGDGDLLVLLPETTVAGAEIAADRLRAAVREIPMLAGAAEWTGGSAEGLVSRARWAGARAA